MPGTASIHSHAPAPSGQRKLHRTIRADKHALAPPDFAVSAHAHAGGGQMRKLPRERHAVLSVRARREKFKGRCRAFHQCELTVEGSGNRRSADPRRNLPPDRQKLIAAKILDDGGRAAGAVIAVEIAAAGQIDRDVQIMDGAGQLWSGGEGRARQSDAELRILLDDGCAIRPDIAESTGSDSRKLARE